MFNSGENYLSAPQAEVGSLASINITPTMTERLKRERSEIASRLAQVDAALAAIESNPAVQQVIDALAKLHWLR